MATEIGSLQLKVDTSEVKQATGQLKDLSAAAGRTQKATGDLSSGANKAAGGLKMMKGGATQVSYQLQDVAVQAQMGTSAFTILAQQGPQIASVFGPAGAAFGTLIAFGSIAMGAVFNGMKSAEGSAEDLEIALDKLDEQFKKTKNNAYELSKRIAELADVSSGAAKAELIALGAEADLAFKKSTKSIDEFVAGTSQSAEQIEGLRFGIEQMAAKGFTLEKILGLNTMAAMNIGVGTLRNTIRDIAEDYKLTSEQAFRFTQAASGLGDGELSSYQNFRSVIDQIGEETGFSNIEFRRFRDTLLEQLEVAETATEKNKILAESLAALNEGGSDALNPFIEGAQEAGEEAETLADRIAAAAERSAKRAAAAAEEQANRQAISIAESLLTEEEAINVSYLKRRDAILEATNLTEQMKNDLILRLGEERDAEMAEAQATFWENWIEKTGESMMTFDTLIAGSISTFQAQAGAAFESFIFDTQNAGDAMKQFAEGMLRSVVNALGQMAAQWLAYYVVQKIAGKGAAAGAGAAMTATATAQSVQAGIAAFASTAAIPIVGPALAPAAATAAIAATAPMVAAVAALSTSAVAARALGGQVRGGESYLVGERGPEILTMGGSNGRIIPNEAIGGGGGGQVTKVANVSFNIQANDTAGFDDLLVSRRGQIIGIINEALNDQGKAAIA